MSIIERDFVQDNGTVKENNYKTKYYVRGEDTSVYRRIGDIPVSGNYEVNLPYPLDSRMLVPKEEYLTSIEWWRTAFGVDTIIYKGMLVTCIETHKTYVYDGPTIKLTAAKQEDDEQEYLPIENWKKQRIDKSLVKWPIDENEEEIIRIGADIVNPCDSKGEDDGVYITKNSDLLGAGLYINEKFISIGKNNTIREDSNTLYPFVPYDVVDRKNPEINFTEAYPNTQTGIYIPTDRDITEPLCIYSAKGINLNNTDDNNKIILNSAGIIDISAAGDINIKLIEDFAIATENNIILNSSSNIKETADNEIEVRANTKNVYIKDNMSLEASTYFVDTSAFKLVADTDISIFGNTINVDATGKLNLKYGNSAKIYSGDSSGLIDISTGISIKAPTDISINSNNSNILLTAKKGTINLDSSDYINKTSKKYEVVTPDLLFNVNNNSANYAKILSNSTGNSNLSLETKFGGRSANISLNNNNININADGDIGVLATGAIDISTNDDITIYTDGTNVFAVDDTSIRIGAGSSDNDDDHTPLIINGYIYPKPTREQRNSECILRLKKGTNKLQWSKDIGVKHASSEAGIAGYARLVEIDFSNTTHGYETVILAVSQSWNGDESNAKPNTTTAETQIYEIKIDFNNGTIEPYVQCLTGFYGYKDEDIDRNESESIKIVTRDEDTLDIWVYVDCHSLSWNILTYSDNCAVTETLDLTNDVQQNPVTINHPEKPIKEKRVIPVFNTSTGTSGNTDTNIGKLSPTRFIIPNPSTNVIGFGKSGFLKFTRTGDKEGNLEWGNSENLIKSFANNDTDTKVYIVGTEKSSNSAGSEGISFHEFYNDNNVYIDQYCNIFATAFYATSDERKKKDIKEIEFNDASILIPKEYRFKESNKKAYGFIAQEVEKAGYEDIVNTDKDTGDKTLDYNSAFAIAIAQMQAKIKQLEDEIKELKNK